MSILTWSEIVECLHHVASSEAADVLPDIYQLDGFCKLMDSESFIPFSAEDFGPMNAIREERYYQVLDAVFNALIADKTLNASAKNLRATAYRYGYVRYIRVKGYALSINYDRRLWRSTGSEETPFWVEIMTSDFQQPIEYRQALNGYKESWKENLNNGIALALFAPENATLDEIAKDMKLQILGYIDTIEQSLV